jgi:hypothetical protein
VPNATQGNVVIFSKNNTVLEWDAVGGTISNCDICFQNDSRDMFFYALAIKPNAVVTLRNCSVSSQQHTAICVTENAIVNLMDCRLHHSQQAGLTLLKMGAARAVRERVF